MFFSEYSSSGSPGGCLLCLSPPNIVTSATHKEQPWLVIYTNALNISIVLIQFVRSNISSTDVLFSNLVYSALTLYDEDIGSSPSLVLTTSASSLDDDWDDRASSAIVSGGCQWILYDTAGFEDRSSSSSAISPSVIGPGSYPFSNLPTFGLPDNVLSAVRCLPAERTPAIVLFEHRLYLGEMQVINFSNPNLELSGFDDRASSFVITGGVWELYSGANYTGSMVTLRQGLYPTPFFLRPIGNDALTSVRLIVFGKKGTRDISTF